MQKAQQDRSREIFVVNHGWHTGIAIESGALNREIPALAVRFPAGKYYELGWGDADFYRAGEGTTGLALRAIFWSSGSVLRVASFSESPLLCFRGCDVRKIAVSQEGYSRLVEFIVSSFRTGPNGEIIPDAAAFGTGDSQFYSATGRYHAFNTCNKWTAKALYSAGLDIGTAFVVSASGVMDSLPETPDSR